MSFPVVESVAESSVNTAGTSHAVTLPASIAASDLVLLLIDIGSTSATFNALTDWTELLDEASANGLKIIYYTGAGVPGNPTFTSSASTRSASLAYRISGANKLVAPQIATTGTGTSATPDPPSVTPTGGISKDYLFIAFYGAAGEEADDDTWSDTPPTNYTPSPPRQKSCGTVGANLGGLIAAAERQLTTGSAQDPGTFAKDVSAAWRSQHIIVHPLTVTMASTADGTSTVTGALGIINNLLSSVAGDSTVTASLDVTTKVAASVAGTSTVTGALTNAIGLSGTIAGSSTVTGALKLTYRLASTVAGTSSASGSLSVHTRLFGSISGTSTVTGALTAVSAINLAGTITGSSTVTGALTVITRLSASTSGTSTVTGSLTTYARPSTSASGSSTVIGSLTTYARLSASITGSSTVNGALATPGIVNLAGLIAGSSTVTSSLATYARLSTLVGGSATVLANLKLITKLASSPSGASSVTAALSGSSAAPTAIGAVAHLDNFSAITVIMEISIEETALATIG